MDFLTFLVALSVLWSCNGANILFLSEVPSLSHHLWLRVVALELADEGHNITFVSCDRDVSLKNVHFIHMEKVYDTVWASEGFDLNLFEMGGKNIFLQYLDTPLLVMEVCDGLMRSSGWKELNDYPKSFKFDLIIHDYLTGGCLLAFSGKFSNPPLVSMTAFRDNALFHMVTKTAVIPSRNTLPYFYRSLPTSFLERTSNFLLHMFDKIIWNWYLYPTLTKMVEDSNFFDYPFSIAEEEMKSKIFLTNYDPAVDGIQQLPANVIGVGGLHIKTPKSLPKDLHEIADSANNGLILFSLGTNFNIQEFGESRINNILECFENFPEYTFLWKIDFEIDYVRMPKNVIIRKWVPQSDVLAHRNTKLFITHGGLLSIQEAVWYGVPMLGIPLFFDQYSNIHNSVDRGYAEVVYAKDLTVANLSEMIFLMMTTPKYREKMKIFSNAFRDKMSTPLERAIWWIKWVMNNPNSKVFEGHGRDLNFLQIESVDVISFLTILCVIALYMIVLVIGKCLCRRI